METAETTASARLTDPIPHSSKTLSLSLSLSHTHTHTHTLTQVGTVDSFQGSERELIHTHSYTNSHTHSLTHTYTLTHSLSHTERHWARPPVSHDLGLGLVSRHNDHGLVQS